MALNEGNYSFNHLRLFPVIFYKGVEREVFVDPNPAEALLIDGNHPLGDLKSSKSIVEPLKSNSAFF